MNPSEQTKAPAKDAQAGTRRPGRPRSAQADIAIIGATLQTLLEDGYGGLSIERVAERAGVSKATIYRRYANKSALVLAAMEAAPDPAGGAFPDTGSVAEDVAQFLEGAVTASGGDARALLAVPRLIAESAIHDRELFEAASNKLVARNQEAIKYAVEREIERGRLRADLDLDLVADMFIGAFVFQLLRTGGDGSKSVALAKRSIELIIEGMHPQPAGDDQGSADYFGDSAERR